MIKDKQSEKWTSGDYKPIASFEITDEELEKKSGQKILKGVEEGLGEWYSVAGLLPSGREVEFIKYLLSPTPKSYVIKINKDDDTYAALSEIVVIFELKHEDFVWDSRKT